MRVDAAAGRRLVEDLQASRQRIMAGAARAVDDSAERGAATARANARQTSGTHGRHYPRSITWDRLTVPDGVAAEFGPDASKKQGSMGAGFEYGSVNQTTPHLDNNRAADAEEPRFLAAVNGVLSRELG